MVSMNLNDWIFYERIVPEFRLRENFFPLRRDEILVKVFNSLSSIYPSTELVSSLMDYDVFRRLIIWQISAFLMLFNQIQFLKFQSFTFPLNYISNLHNISERTLFVLIVDAMIHLLYIQINAWDIQNRRS